MKLHKIPASVLVACLLASMTLMTACEDERIPPSAPSDTTYSETIMLLEYETAAGQRLSAPFELLDNVKDGFIRLTCYFDPDPTMEDFEKYGSKIDSLSVIINEELKVGIDKLVEEIDDFPSRLGRMVADTVSLGVGIDTLGTDLDDLESVIDSLEAIDPRNTEQDSILNSWLQLQEDWILLLEGWQDQKDSLIVLYDSLLIRKEVIPVQKEVYRVQKAVDEALVNEGKACRDILDIILDDRFKVSVALDDDTIEYYPEAIFINDTVEVTTGYFNLDPVFFNPDGSIKDDAILDPGTIDPTHLDQALYDSLRDVLIDLIPALDDLRSDIGTANANWDTLVAELPADSVMVWGQGIFLALYPDNISNPRGITFKLDLDEFWVADSGWSVGEPFIHDVRPQRGDAWTNQFPVRDFRSRMNSGRTHTLHFRLGAEGTDTRVTASLYAVYYNKVVR